MKTWFSQTRLVAVLGAVISLPTVSGAEAEQSAGQPAGEPIVTPVAVAAEPAAQRAEALRTAASTRVATTPASDANAKLPYGVDEVLKLSRARMNDDVTLNYIQNSGTIYNLSAQDLIYMKNQGVSDKVINAMQDQKKRALEALSQTSASSSPAVEVYAGTPASIAAPVYAPQQPIYVQEPMYNEPVSVSEPEYGPASSLYVIPYPSPTYPRYTLASSYPSYAYYGTYTGFGPPLFRPRIAAASRGGPVSGVYRFGGGGHGGGRSGGGHVGGGGSHVMGGGHGHSGHR